MLKPLIPAGGCVVDVGANVGCLSLAFAHCVGPQGRVLAFEPQRRVFYNLCANILINELFWVQAYHCLIGDREGTIPLPLQQLDRPAATRINRGGVSFVEELQAGAFAEAGSERLPIHRLDDLLADLPACHLVKVDVEGAEPLVLQGMQETLRTRRPYLYLECGSEALHGQLMPLLDDQNYAAFWHPALHFHPGNYRQAGNFTGSKGDLNLLCVPRERLQGEHASVWEALPAAGDWASIAERFPGFQF